MADAIILAAGYGKRMLPLTENKPKPLIQIQGTSLIEYQIRKLVSLNTKNIWVNINLDHFGLQIPQTLGFGEKWNINIHYFYEQKPLNTGASLLKIISKIRSKHLWIISADSWMNQLQAPVRQPKINQSYIYIVPKPKHLKKGDFFIQKNGRIATQGLKKHWTYSGIGLYSLDTIKKIKWSTNNFHQLSLKQILDQMSIQKKLFTQTYQGIWEDIGTVKRLQNITNLISGAK